MDALPRIRPISALKTQATKAACVFDLDGTLVPMTGLKFALYLYARRPDLFFHGPYHGVNMARWGLSGSAKKVLQGFERALQDGVFKRYYEKFVRRPVADQIYPRGAEELAWRRANLQPVILATGAFTVHAAPYLSCLQADHVIINDRFWRAEEEHPLKVYGKSKPHLVRPLLNKQGWFAQAVYTDSHQDLPLLEMVLWPETFLMDPDKTLRNMAQERNWKILHKNELNPDLPAPVREYARDVIRQPDRELAKVRFYQSWKDRIMSQRALRGEAHVLRDCRAAAGLYLKETEETREGLTPAVGPDFDPRCFSLYETLVARNPASPTPLMIHFPL